MNRSLLRNLLVVPSVAGLLALGSASAVSAAGPIESDPVLDPARAGLAHYLAQFPVEADSDGELPVDGCPIIAAEDFMAALSFFGPVGEFDAFDGVLVSGGFDEVTGYVGVGCDAERSVAQPGGVVNAGVGMFDLAAMPSLLGQMTAMPPITIDGADLLGGRIHGECSDSGGADEYRCLSAWVHDGVVVAMYVEFESADSQKDPPTAVARVLAQYVPGVLDGAGALAAQ